MSEKKQAKKADKPRKVYKAKPHPSLKVKRDENGDKIMKVARGTARAKRREGLKKGWKNIGNAKKMAPSAMELAMQAAA